MSNVQGRYPLPDSSNKALKDCNAFGYYGNLNVFLNGIYGEVIEVLSDILRCLCQNKRGKERR